jgi:hypothetical protein
MSLRLLDKQVRNMTNVLNASNLAEVESKPKLSVRALLFENLMSVPEIMADMKVQRSTVYKWSSQGAPFEKKMGELYADPKKLAEWLERRGKR